MERYQSPEQSRYMGLTQRLKLWELTVRAEVVLCSNIFTHAGSNTQDISPAFKDVRVASCRTSDLTLSK